MYTTGFCNIGSHEGMSPVSPEGRPMKTCTAIEVCECSCHTNITSMYEMSGIERVVRANPDYEPARNVDLMWLQDMNARSAHTPHPSTMAPVPTPVVVDDSDHDGGVPATAPTPADHDGGRPRGYLETEVHKVCKAYVLGDYRDRDIDTMDCQQIATLVGESSSYGVPSTGAVGNVLRGWEKIEFAIIKEKPLRFTGLTTGGLINGLQYVKYQYKEANRR